MIDAEVATPVDFAARIKVLAKRVPLVLPKLETEEATKNALIMPFISALGYDVFDPHEVVPEFTADVGTKKGEKVDYAIKRGDEIIMLVEAKKAGESLSINHSGQLFRYFSVTKARIAILTNGVQYRLYSDLDEPNRMDEKPFLELDLENLRENLLEELAKLTKDSFDLENMLSAASDLKHMREIRTVFESQLETPSEEFVKFFFVHANPSARFVQSIKIQFGELVKRTLNQVLTDRINARLRSAMAQEDEARRTVAEKEAAAALVEDTEGVVTTQEELDGYQIVRAIVCAVVPADKVGYRDARSYFSVLYDDSNRRPICRLHLNRQQKYIGLFDAMKRETKHPLRELSDIYQFATVLRETAARYGARDTGSFEPIPAAESA